MSGPIGFHFKESYDSDRIGVSEEEETPGDKGEEDEVEAGVDNFTNNDVAIAIVSKAIDLTQVRSLGSEEKEIEVAEMVCNWSYIHEHQRPYQ